MAAGRSRVDRKGLVIGEGAGVLVLEEAGHAEARGAEALMEIAGFGMSADGAELTAPSADGAARAMRAALADAGCTPEQVGYVNAHGTGTRLNDKTETAALRSVFGAALAGVPVSSTKSMIGHCMTAGGALELIATAMALREGVLPPTAGFTDRRSGVRAGLRAERGAPCRGRGGAVQFVRVRRAERRAGGPARMIVPHINRIGTAVPAHDVHAAFIAYARTLLPDEKRARCSTAWPSARASSTAIPCCRPACPVRTGSMRRASTTGAGSPPRRRGCNATSATRPSWR